MAEQILQRIVMPPRRGLARLYYRCRGGSVYHRKRERRAIALPYGTVLQTDTWFNAFFERHWRQQTRLSRLALRLRVSGVGILRLYRRSSEQEPILLREIDFSSPNRQLFVEIPDT